ncbi:MAG TPA: TetR/AcrR family transcriptional regulator [Gemmatimonadales bacterium]|nr:TetR/AcrR family transcriptional regulator [Gemmatimonadales bacterium]
MSMGSQERRSRERVETRQRILEAAREMFVRLGYEATTMRAIAERIEYTATAIYHHFRNKEELLTELATTDFRALAAAFQRIGRIEDPIERLRRIGDAYVDFALEHPMQYQLMFMTTHPQMDVKGIAHGDPSEDAYAFLRDVWTAAIATGRLRPEFTDPEELAQMCWASLHGLLALHIVKHGEKQNHGDDWIAWRDARKTAARMSEALMRGLLQQPKD